MLKLGEKIISDIYLGDKKIAKVFLGDKLVYQANKPIFLDYVIFDGNSWVDTGIEYQTCTAEITVKYYEDNKRMLNGWSDQAGCYWGMYTNGRLELGNTYLNNTNLREKTTVNISLDTSTNTLTAAINGESISRSGTGASRSYWIGATTSVSSAKVVGEVYGSKFWNAEGEVIKDFRPCIDPKGTVCFYDLVTKKYFYNQGTGTLTAGNKIKFVDYIITDGSSYIDTEFCPSENTYIEYTFEVTQTPTASYNGLFGSRQDTAYYLYNVFATSALTFRIDYGRYNETGHLFDLNTKYTMRAGNGEIYINDKLVKSYTVTYKGTSPYSMYLGNFNNKGTPYATGTAQRIYPCPIYENGVLVRDFKPCIAPNGQVAMYDEVNKKYHYNVGTGELKAGGRFVKSILFDGASYINTGIKHQTCIVECDIRFEETGTRQLMGFGTGSGQYWGAGATGIFDYMAGTNALDRTDVVIDFNAEEFKYTIYADGESRTSASGNALSSLTYRIGAGPTGVSSNAYWCTCEVWGNKFTVNGEVIQDLRPYVDENGTACFKDLVTGNLFYNKGTGTLGYTE